MRIFRYFKKHILALVTCILLLFAQANCALALPEYMSQIVDVGIQQKGIASAVPKTIRQESLSDLEMFMTQDEINAVNANFSKPNAEGICTYQGSSQDAQEGSWLAHTLATPEALMVALQQGIDVQVLQSQKDTNNQQSNHQITPEKLQAANRMQDLLKQNNNKINVEYVRLAYQNGFLTKQELLNAKDGMNQSLGEMSGSLISQRAISYIENEYQEQHVDIDSIQNDYLMHMALTMFAFCLATLICAVLVSFLAAHTGAKIAQELRQCLFEHVMDFSPAEVSKFSQASLITRCTNDIQQIQMVVTMIMRMVIYAPIMGIVALGKVLSTHTGLEWTIGCAILFVLALVGILSGIAMPKFRIMQKVIDRVNLVSREMLDGIMPIRAFNQEEHELERFDTASKKLMDTQLFTNRVMTFMMPGMNLAMNAIVCVIVWFGAHGIDIGSMQVGDMIAFINYAMQIVISFTMITMVAVMLPRASVAAGRVDEVINTDISIYDPQNPTTPSEKHRGELRFNDVSFAYPDSQKSTVKHISFSTHPGKMTAIIGTTGSGKSTIVQLAPRLFDPSEGTIELDGVNIKQMNLSDLRSRIGYVPQQGMLFSGTLQDNINFSSDTLSSQDAQEALQIAQGQEIISEDEKGLDRHISQKGSNVSGGQRQRIAIARAIANKPEILILDDAFSALDYATDARLRKTLHTQMQQTAVLVVAQRVASIMEAAEILVLDDGVVVGRGTHAELLQTCQTYRDIALSQLSEDELGLSQTK